MNLYLDSSSLLKLYLAEDGSSTVAYLVSVANNVSTSLITYAEARSGLVRARRAGRLSDDGYHTAVEKFEADWRGYDALDIEQPLVRSAGDLAEKHLLRSFDAIHLASAVTLQTELADPVTFSASDARLMSAAQSEGLTIP